MKVTLDLAVNGLTEKQALKLVYEIEGLLLQEHLDEYTYMVFEEIDDPECETVSLLNSLFKS